MQRRTAGTDHLRRNLRDYVATGYVCQSPGRIYTVDREDVHCPHGSETLVLVSRDVELFFHPREVCVL
jgi:hypothetical protein